jgi:hypothetical protein
MATLINCKGLGFRVFSWKSSFTRVWDLGFSPCKVPCKGGEKRVVFQKTKLWRSHLWYTKIYRITICRNDNGLVWLHNLIKKWERIWSHNSKVGLCTGVKQGGVSLTIMHGRNVSAVSNSWKKVERGMKLIYLEQNNASCSWRSDLKCVKQETLESNSQECWPWWIQCP